MVKQNKLGWIFREFTTDTRYNEGKQSMIEIRYATRREAERVYDICTELIKKNYHRPFVIGASVALYRGNSQIPFRKYVWR